MDTLPNYQNATFENVWAGLMENREQMKETDRLMQETDRKMEESGRRIDKLYELMGSWNDNLGSFAEEYFYNSFEKGQQNFFGEKFDEIEKNLKPRRKQNIEDEYDIVMSNGSSVAIVEIKFKAHLNDLVRIKKKATTYRILCPEHKDYKIYLGIASLSYYPELEQACIAEGIAIIKQLGDMVVIHDEHLKVF
jgi:hypothetical protein